MLRQSLSTCITCGGKIYKALNETRLTNQHESMPSPRRSERPKKSSAKQVLILAQSSKLKPRKKRQRSPSSDELSSGGDGSDKNNVQKKKPKSSKKRQQLPSSDELCSGGDRSDENNVQKKKKSMSSKRTRRHAAVSDIEQVDIPEVEEDDIVEMISNGFGPGPASRGGSEEKVGARRMILKICKSNPVIE